MSKGIAIDWIKNLPKDEAVEFEKTLRHSTIVLSRLSEILDEQIKNLDRQEMTSEAYDSPSWAYKQAHLNGERSRLTKVKQLLSFLET